MIRVGFLLFLCLLPLFSACSFTGDNRNNVEYAGYFSDASNCHQAAVHKDQVKVRTGQAMTVIDIPLGHNAGAFSQCMMHAGHAPPKVSPEQYLQMSAHCLDEARGADNPDAAFGYCIKAGALEIEVVPDGKTP